MKRLHLGVAVLGLGLLSAGAWWWQRAPGMGLPGAGSARPVAAAASRPVAAPVGPVAVEVAPAVVRDLVDDTTAVGSLRSRQSVTLRPEVGGRVVRLGFVDGQRVSRGQLLVQLDDALQQAQLHQAQAQLEIAGTTLRRNQELVAQNFVTQSVVDQAQANVKVAEAQVALARAQLDKLRIVAPFDGQAGIRAVDVGDYLKDGAAIVSLEDASSLYVDFSLPERFASRLRAGQSVAVQIDALPGEGFSALVQALEPQITADGRAIAVRARLPNADARLRAGMFARVRVTLAQRQAAVLVPEEAVLPQAGRDALVKVVDTADGPRARRIDVITGLRRDGRVEIVSGLAAGERVVTAGHGRLLRAEDQPVRIVDPSARARPAATASAPVAMPATAPPVTPSHASATAPSTAPSTAPAPPASAPAR